MFPPNGWGRAWRKLAYVAGWLKILKADKRAVFTAAAKAREAAAFLLSERNEEDAIAA